MALRFSDSNPFEVLRKLQKTDLWAAMDEDQRQRIYSSGGTAVASDGDTICHQNSDATFLYFICSGTVRMPRFDPGGRRNIAGFGFGSNVSVLPGDFIGLSFDDFYPHSIESISDSLIYRIPRIELLAADNLNTEVGKQILRLISAEHHRVQDHLDIVMDGTVQSKLARLLLLFTQRLGQQVNGGFEIIMPMRRRDVADHLGHSIESVSRAFTQLRFLQAVSFSDDDPYKLLIPDTDLLLRLAYQKV